jgi:pyruvate-formate lyase-activating enzyme
MTTAPGERGRFGTTSVRAESWGGLALDEAHDRIWGFDRLAFQEFLHSLRPDRRSPQNAPATAQVGQLTEALRRYGPGVGSDENPYLHRGPFFIGQMLSQDGFALSAPINISWITTQRCQSRCIMCCVSSASTTARELSEREMIEAARIIAAWGVLRVTLGGGEPLLRNDLPRVAAALAAGGVRPVVATNGLLLGESTLSVLAHHCSLVQISLDTVKQQTYRQMRGVDGLADAQAAIENCVRLGVPLRVVTVLTRHNEFDLGTIARYLASEGVQQWFVFLVQPSGRARRDYKRLFPSDLPTALATLRELGALHSRLAVCFWGQKPEEHIAPYVTAAGMLEIFNYQTGKGRALWPVHSAGIEQLAQVWGEVSSTAQFATLRNFTSSHAVGAIE